MPITLTATGHEEILASLQNLSDKLRGPEVVETLAKESSIILAQNAPVGERGMTRGLLQRTVSEVAGPEPTGQGWWAGVGNLEGIYPLEPAPPDTIKNFLEMIRGRVSGTEAMRIGAKPRRKKAGTHFNPKRAWWYLSEEEKEQLRAAREAGIEAVGGTSPYRPFYWWIQEEGRSDVGIRGQHYITRAIHQIRSRIGQVILQVLGRDRGGPIPTDYGAFYR